MPNIADMNGRLVRMEQRLDKLISFQQALFRDSDDVPAVRLSGMTSAERTALGVTLSGLDDVIHLLVYDTQTESFFTWSGTEWV